MSDPYPFHVHNIEEAHRLTSNWVYSILANVSSYEHADLFDQYGYSGNGPSWAEHIQAILESDDPELLDHLEQNEEADTYLVYADSQAAVDRFLKLIVPIFSDPTKLEAYFSQTDPEEFFELK